MESRLVLVIEGDDRTASQIAAAIREADYEVVVSSTAAAGLAAAIEIRPDCVVCDVELPDDDGHSVAKSIRTHPSPVAVTPFLFLSPYDDARARLEGFQVGADVYMTKPFHVEEVVAQVDALVQMAARLRQRRDSALSMPPDASYGTTAIEGDVRQMSVATVLSVLGMERRTGVFEVVSKKRRAQVEIVAGFVVHGTIGGTRVNALTATRLMLSWKVGRFSFTPLPPCDPPPSLRTVQALLLDAAKAEDEAAAGMAPSSVRLYESATMGSFGGPPSRPDDTGPPSSRAMREAASAPVSLAFDLVPSLGSPAATVDEAAAAAAALSALEAEWGSPLSTRPPPRLTTTKRPPPATSAPKTARAPAGPAISITDDGTISIDTADLAEEPGLLDDGERMFVDETPRAPSVTSRTDVRSAPTPPAGIAMTRPSKPAIVPPPDASAASMKPLPAPPAPPRPMARAPEKGRAPGRASPKK